MEGSFEILMPDEFQMTLSAHLLIVRKSDIIVSSQQDGSIVLLDSLRGKYYGLGHTGSRIWELAHEPITVGCVVNALLNEYDIDRMSCETEVFSFLARLSEERLIQFGM